MIVNKFSWKIGGEAGYGILSAGAMFSRAMLRAGLHVFDYAEYPSLIRGGHNTYEVNASVDEVQAPHRPIAILVALNRDTVDTHRSELAEDGAIIVNTDNTEAKQEEFLNSMHVIEMPLETLATKAGAPQVARNVVGMGASFALFKAPLGLLEEVIKLNFTLKNKDERVIEVNVLAAKAGYEFIQNNFKPKFNYQLHVQPKKDMVIMTGNDAISWGAISAGCKFFSAYPMTPATSILHTLAAQAKKYNIGVRHAEDEIGAINDAIGAGYAGVRAMTATSGGGFCLMTEAWGMAGIVEVPLVAVEAMRTGPSTGMPTWGGQGDLRFLLSASHGEFPRFVIAPGDVAQCYNLIQDAFNIAERYQTPVMFITDKFLAASHASVSKAVFKKKMIDRGEVVEENDIKAGEFKRYEHTPSGVSPRALPGTKGGEHVANSDEHNELGFSEEGSEERTKMMDKRFRKLEAAKHDIPDPVLEGEKKADITILSWGSTRGPILEAMKVLRYQGKKINFLQIIFISPFPSQKVKEVFKKAKKVVVIENNKTGQLAGILREETGLNPDYKLLKYDGRPFFTHELVEAINDLK